MDVVSNPFIIVGGIFYLAYKLGKRLKNIAPYEEVGSTPLRMSDIIPLTEEEFHNLPKRLGSK